MDEQNKNLILATVLSFLVIIVWFLIAPPESVTQDADDPSAISETAQGTQNTPDLASVPSSAPAADGTPAALEPEPVDPATISAPRLIIETESLQGSISLKGGRIDDLSLRKYNETLDEDSDIVRLLAPVGETEPYYAIYGWAPNAGVASDGVPGPNTLWGVEGGTTLTVETPVTLVWDNGAGLIFRREIAVDADYLFTITQWVENTSNFSVTLAPYGIIARHGEPDTIGFFILHEGVVRMSDGSLQEMNYDDMPELDGDPNGRGVVETIDVEENGWIGFTTNKYWMTNLIPAPGSAFTSSVRYNPANDIYQTEVVLPAQTVVPGGSAIVTTQLFAGAKEWATIRKYQNEGGIEGFIDSIDWGWFFFFTKPMFAVLHWLNGLIGNMGWAILALTVVIKALVLPLAYKSYVSMANMKALQPEMEKLKERTGDDKQAMQKGMMALYKENKVNPASGCLPIIVQIPIFFSLYKVIFVTIELRHAPWILWIRDLAEPDPSSILNLFGLLPFSPPDPGSLFALLSLGILPILLGISMWIQQKLNPAPTDPTQKMIFAWMPWVFMFMLGSFASGLVLYWIANNTITFSQQYVIMRSQGHKPDIFGNIRESFKKKIKPTANDDKPPRKK